MWPQLARFTVLGRELSISSYGSLVAAGFVIGIWVAVRAARRSGSVDPLALRELCMWMLVGGLAGGRLLYVAVNAGGYWRVCVEGTLRDCTRPLQVWEGGLVYYGGVAGAALVLWWVARRRRIPPLRAADLIVVGLSLGHFIGRLGCFAVGCCFGKPTASGWGAHFPAGSVAHDELLRTGALVPGAAHTAGLHPTQLYESLGELALFALLALVVAPRKRADGQVFGAYLVGYALLRAVVELFRGDEMRRWLVRLETPSLNHALGFPVDAPSLLSVSQALSLVTIAVGVWLVRAHRRKS